MRRVRRLALDPLDALHHVFPNADPRKLEACLATSSWELQATVQAYRDRQAKDEMAAWDGCSDDRHGQRQEPSVVDLGDDRGRCHRECAVTEATIMQEENATLREQATAMEADTTEQARGVRVKLKS
ncbi:hypothetical protein GUJ93_ZPchr0006g41561 [Zizania palustris]|uniref:CUE domain-containing protein n=1 Tax=Zizania palustris TaxID=103762 RepID=A0A8J5VXD6_ZIZPA|nr:hypothetical protein GUJ93_ZPchr0006g41561 [Zizania palustris]